MKPVCIELFAGLHGWGAGFVEEGFTVIGFDIEDMGKLLGIPRPPNCHLVLQDVRTLHGSQFRNATCIVASPPCQAYSYRAMPWSRAKALPPPDNTLFDACFRIQREACEAAGRHIPMVVENVRGAQKWVGRAKWHFGSYYLWGDVPALMPIARTLKVGRNSHQFAQTGIPSASFNGAPHEMNVQRAEAIKVSGLNFSDYGKPDYKAGAFNDTAVKQQMGGSWFGDYEAHKERATEAIKQGGDWFGANCESSMSRMYGSKSPKRKAASALIAKIPYALANHIAKCFHAHSELYGLGTQKDLSQSQDV